MSTKTTFKRIALVAVAALGLGVLSVAPSSAAVSGATISGTNASVTLRSGSTTLADSDTTTAATISVYLLLQLHRQIQSLSLFFRSRSQLVLTMHKSV